MPCLSLLTENTIYVPCEVAELEGEKLDVIGATEEDWQDVIMEIYMGVMDLNSQFQSIGN